MSTRRRTILAAALLIIAAGALASLAGGSKLEQAIVPDAPYPGTPTGVPCDEECGAFLAAIAPSLRELVAEGSALATLGTSRSRDVLELTVRMNRFQSSADEFAFAIENHPVPASMIDTISAIDETIDRAQASIDESIAALRSFDWDALGLAVDEFDAEIQHLTVLAAELNI
jgi:hypothetical protein